MRWEPELGPRTGPPKAPLAMQPMSRVGGGAFTSLQRWGFYQVGRATLSLVKEPPTPGKIPLTPPPKDVHRAQREDQTS